LVTTNVFTFGGIKVSPTARVVNCEGYEIPGLYAAGEVIGMYYGAYSGATSFLRGMVFGRLAGENAAGRS
jgi:tricarballylate dehydrogenase